jgi:predicted nucleotidyltransferase component of viral defense system
MIDRNEIEAKAKEFEIHPANVQRDYIFGWLLYGIFTQSGLKDRIFLKGGNALRKGFFNSTRYSTDLDFGVPDDIDANLLLQEINGVCDFVQEKAGVAFVKERNQVDEKFPPGENAPLPDLRVYEVNVYFEDFYGNPEKFTLKIAMDLTRFDRTIYEPVMVPLIHPYSDAAEIACQIRCMKLEEIIATKLKCLMQRQNAPDLYDYAYSIQLLGGSLNKDQVREALIQKTIFDKNPFLLKGILGATDFGYFRDAWLKSIICAKQYLMQVEEAIQTFTNHLEELFAGIQDNGYAQSTYFPVDARVAIMRAARTQTKLRIRYKGDDRIVEPYALKYMQPRNRDPKEYLYVFNCSGGSNPPGVRQFVAENLQSIENTDDSFVPQYPIELSKAGETPEDPYLFDPNKPQKAPKRRSVFAPRARRTRSFASSIKYVYQCTYCGKRFYKSTQNGALRPHKDKHGYQCGGRQGYYVDTKYS